MKCTLIELNEFNEDLLKQASIYFGLTNIQKILQLHRVQTVTEDRYESDFLEPWVQWVSVHTGKPSSEHQIKHLGDVPNLGSPQIWEILSENGFTSGVWGAMNASRANAKNNLFFLPDPWTASERAYPEELNQLLDPLRFASKNYLGSVALQIIQQLKGLIQLIYSHDLGWETLKKLPAFISQLARFKGAHFVLIAFVEHLSTQLFLSFKKRYNPDFSLIFINTLAHIQHHYWTDFNYQENKKLKLGLYYLDQMLGKILKALEPTETLFVTNALSQKNTSHEKPWILYRPLDHANLLEKVGIYAKRIEAHMTHDAHLYFQTPQECQKAAHLLQSAQIQKNPLFFIETYPEEPSKLFYRIAFTDAISKSTLFSIGGKELKFFDFYKAIVKRTGKHIPHGTLFSNVPMGVEKIYNHDLFSMILENFSCKELELMQRESYIKKS